MGCAPRVRREPCRAPRRCRSRSTTTSGVRHPLRLSRVPLLMPRPPPRQPRQRHIRHGRLDALGPPRLFLRFLPGPPRLLLRFLPGPPRLLLRFLLGLLRALLDLGAVLVGDLHPLDRARHHIRQRDRDQRHGYRTHRFPRWRVSLAPPEQRSRHADHSLRKEASDQFLVRARALLRVARGAEELEVAEVVPSALRLRQDVVHREVAGREPPEAARAAPVLLLEQRAPVLRRVIHAAARAPRARRGVRRGPWRGPRRGSGTSRR